jgi:hypothetical protein
MLLTEKNFKNYLVESAEELDCWWLPDWIERKWELYNEEGK